MRRFLRVLRAFLRRDLREDLSYRASFIFSLGSAFVSIGTLLFFSRLVGQGQHGELASYGGSYFSFALLGLVLFQLQHTAVAAYPQEIRRAQLAGTLEALLATPAPSWLVLLCSPAYRFVRAMVNLTVLLGVGVLVGKVDLSQTDLLSLVVALGLSLGAFAGLGFVAAALTMIMRRPAPVGMFVGGLSTLLGGVLYPTSVLPSWAATMGEFLPITHGAELIRRSMLLGAPLSDMGPSLIKILVYNAAVLPIGLALFVWTIKRARRDGSLSHY